MKFKKILNTDKMGSLFSKLYGKSDKIFHEQILRYRKIISEYEEHFFTEPDYLFSAPGRTEIGGNHTDHNRGRVLAASINLDSVAAVCKMEENKIVLYSEGYPQKFEVMLNNLTPKDEEKGTTTALIRGIAAQFKELGYNIGGFNAYISSNVGVGSGLSSSASIEVLIGTILNVLFNESNISDEEIAIIGQFSENNYFGKPCGLMDQMAIAVGGIISIDFIDTKNPIVKKINFDLSEKNYTLLVVDTGDGHADLTEDYASIPLEMKSVAKEFGKEVCREISYDDLLNRMNEIRTKVGDRAILRAIHFLEDNQRVVEEVDALEKGDFNLFLDLVNESGNSSCKWLQNCFTTKNPSKQSINLALALTENYLKNSGRKGACRVHGGGFAGTIQVFIPNESLDAYLKMIKNVFGKKSVKILSIRPIGPIHLNSDL